MESTLPPPPSSPGSSLAPPPPPPGDDPSPRRSPLRRWFFPLLALAIIGVTLPFSQEGIGAVVALFVLVVPFEKMFPRHKGQKVRRKMVGTDIAHALSTPATGIVGVVVAVIVGVVSLAWIPGLLISPLVAQIPSPYNLILALLLFDFAIYWVHRWSHEVPFLWRFHAIHHSTEHLDWISGFRNHPFDGAIVAPPFIFLLAAGFSAEGSGTLAVVQLVTGLFLHANVRWRLRPLHRLIITPEFHHWHHASEKDAINTNYSVFLPAWDLIFGTYFMPKNRRPQRYGVAEHVPDGLVPQLLHPLRGMKNPLRLIIHPIRSIKALWRFTRQLLREVRRSTFRPTHRARAATSA